MHDRLDCRPRRALGRTQSRVPFPSPDIQAALRIGCRALARTSRGNHERAHPVLRVRVARPGDRRRYEAIQRRHGPNQRATVGLEAKLGFFSLLGDGRVDLVLVLAA